MTEQEIIAVLEKSSLPTLLVEGKGDETICRWLESQFGILNLDILSCTGKETLLSIYRRRASFAHGKLAWLADLDMWCHTPPPTDLEGVLFTTGYSIENDLYAGSNIESLMDADERIKHSQLLRLVCRWFAFEVLECRSGRDARVGYHINRFVDFQTMELDARFCSERGYTEPDIALVEDLLTNYKLHLRGKTLLQALMHFLSNPSRTPKHSTEGVVEVCLRLYLNNPYIRRIVTEIKAKLG